MASVSSASPATSSQTSSLKDPQLRKKCFDARDNYYQCYRKDGPEECHSQLQLYTDSCPENWKQFWENKFKDQMKQFVLEQDALAVKPHGVDTRGKITTNPYG